ncbi:MAG: thiol-disulfide isomerase/thioredoxin [Oleispira sp.]|jgi:thiol-disulfide isomerase/thioredoxin
MKRFSVLLFAMSILPAVILSNSVQASSPTDLKLFDVGSFEQVVKKKDKKDHLVILWSFDCPPCIKELQKVAVLNQQYPEYQLTLINTDGLEEQARVKTLLKEYHLLMLDNWIFSDADEEKLRYDIDARWFGDLPRSYFFPVKGKIKRLKGALTSAELLELFQPTLINQP